MSLINVCFENEIKKGACLRDMMGQTYPFVPVLTLITRFISLVHSTFCS